MEIDFGYSDDTNNVNVNHQEENDKEDKVDIDTGKTDNKDDKGEDVSDIDKDTDKNDDTSSKENKDTNKEDKNTEDKDESNDNVDLVEGTELEVDGKKYTVDKDKNIIDENGNIFKEANKVNEWLKEFNTVEDNEDNALSINKIKDIVGIEITGEDDKPIEYDNTPEGVKNYINDVIENSRIEHYETAINTLTNKFPFLNDIMNYYTANGNSLEGYGEVKDRSNIVIDDTNEAQQEHIIRMAFEEQGRKGDIDSYIEYLKNSGTLLSTAKSELDGLKELDAANKKAIEEEAERVEEENNKKLINYWNGVQEVINDGNIAGYKIPDSIIINRNGNKTSVSKNDFFEYIYRVDNDGVSAYERDLAKETPESRRDDEILRAYLKFVGGDYSNLVDMAIHKKEVERLKLVAKSRKTSTIRINKPKTDKHKNIDLGYN